MPKESKLKCGSPPPVYPYPVSSVIITTCASLYQKRALKKPLYGRARNGLTIEVEYADTLSLCSGPDVPTVLALHGAPGFHDDFKPFLEYFGARNVRLIVPAYPGKFVWLGASHRTYFCLYRVVKLIVSQSIIGY